MSRSRGFTLVELLVGISIIAVLAVIGANIFSGTESKAQDTKRKADIQTIAKAYEAHYTPVGGYQPLDNSWFSSGTVPTPPEGGSYFNELQGITGFRVCATLGGGPQCSVPDPDTCYCVESQQGIYVPSGSPTPTPTASPSPSPTPTPTSSPSPSPTPTPTPPSGCDPGTLTSGLVAYWKMDEIGGTNVADSSGFGKNGIKLSAVEPNPTSDAKIVTANDFDGVNDKINVASPVLPTGNFTYSIWIKVDVIGGANRVMFTSADGTSRDEFGLRLNLSGDVQVWTANLSRLSTAPISTGIWHHIAATRLGGTITAYIDGVVSGTGTDATVLNFGACGLTIGHRQTSSCSATTAADVMDGRMDEAGIWNRALTTSEISALYNSSNGCVPAGI